MAALVGGLLQDCEEGTEGLLQQSAGCANFSSGSCDSLWHCLDLWFPSALQRWLASDPSFDVKNVVRLYCSRSSRQFLRFAAVASPSAEFMLLRPRRWHLTDGQNSQQLFLCNRDDLAAKALCLASPELLMTGICCAWERCLTSPVCAAV